jgi:hypothetical protein
MVHIRSPRSHHWHLTICPTVILRLISRFRRNYCHCLQTMRQLPSRDVLFKEAKELEITGPHTVNRTCDWLRCCGWELMNHPTYGPNLAPSDVELYGALEKRLAVKLFVTYVDVKQAIASWLQTIDFDFFYYEIQASVPRWDICFNLNISGDYVEVWCAPSATRVPCTHRSRNKAFIALFIETS